MKRLITTYKAKPDMFEELLHASEDFVAQTMEQTPAIVECSLSYDIDRGTVSYFVSFPDEQAERSHENAPRTQIFLKLAATLCQGDPTTLELPETGRATGVQSTPQEEEKKEQESISLYKNDREIEELSKKDINS